MTNSTRRKDLVALLVGGITVCVIVAISLLATEKSRPDCAAAVERAIRRDEFSGEERTDFFGFGSGDRRVVREAGERSAADLMTSMNAARYERCSTNCQCTLGGLTTYGRWCGYRHSGCDGYGACDVLDECCQTHDYCVGAHGYTNCTCTTALAKCALCAYKAPFTRDDTCKLRRQAALRILSDIRYVLPSCFDDALTD